MQYIQANNSIYAYVTVMFRSLHIPFTWMVATFHDIGSSHTVVALFDFLIGQSDGTRAACEAGAAV